jgi:hypothetical protein
MSKPYTPQPGTIPARVIDYLKTLPPGTHLSSAALCEELDIEISFLSSSLQRPRTMGAVVSRPVPGNKRNLEWAIGDGTPLPPPPDHEPDEPLQAPVVKRELSPKREVLRSQPLPKLSDFKPTQRDMSDHFLAGVFTDGSLLIEHGGIAITLNPKQAAQIARLTNQGIQQ